MLSEPFRTIADKTTTEPALIVALKRLPKAIVERPQFWSQIANDPGYRRSHRSHVILTLFRRHVHAGMRVGDITPILNRPSWLHERDVDAIKRLMGHIPVRIEFGDSVLRLKVLPVEETDFDSIYFSIKGDVGAESFRRVIGGYQGRLSDYGSEQMRITTNSRIGDIGFELQLPDGLIAKF